MRNKVAFRPRARLMKILGEQLISSEVIALVELVKNSYDADAKNVIIKLLDIKDHDKGKIIIEDDGTGISYDKIVNVWMEPATPDKKNKEQRYSDCFHRRLLGEKGIGRFAVHKLGGKVRLITRATADCFKTLEDYETVVNIDWDNFSENKYLDEVEIDIETRNPEYFINKSGTFIEITNITPWKKSTVISTVRKLKALETPELIRKRFLSKENSNYRFKVRIETNLEEFQKEINSVRTIDEVLDSAFYILHGEINEEGILKYFYKFNRPDYPELARTVEDKVDLKDYFMVEILEETMGNSSIKFKDISPGKFFVDFFVWDLDSSALKVAGLQKEYKEIIKPNAGVRIYRDGFRVWPYGEEDDDWLGLDLKRLNAPKERPVSRNQIIGFISISSEENPELIDQSNREGLIKNSKYEVFYELVKAALKHLANLRKQDKMKMDTIKEKNAPYDEVTQKIHSLKNNMKKNGHYNIYKKDIEDIENTYKEKVTEIIERYMQAAAIGIGYTLPVHELNIRFKSINSILEEIRRNPLFMNQYIRELEKIVLETQDIVKVIGTLMQKKKRKYVLIRKVIENVLKLKERELRKYNIDISINGDMNQKAYMLENLMGTALLNIIDNAIYWIRVKRAKLREKGQYHKGKIEIIIGEDNNHPFIIVKDNGTGIKDPVEMLVEPYYSRKSDGYGLGLYIVDNIMKRHNGRIEAYNWDNGAVFKLIFGTKENSKGGE